ncbi:ABC transporter substrate-binding protein [Kineococcus sp. LSe6-4]|uniref:ABC transporter substrate-binding protein n=1 Tax=Kineococcus halophytocola TaxID=3234027 RepID=A0ABV4H0R2_9ACTN
MSARSISRRTTLAAGMATASAAALTGCSRFGASGGGTDADSVQLTVMTWADAQRAADLETVFAAYHEANPGVTVKLEWMDVGSYPDKLNTRFAAGNPPDVMFIVGRWLGEYASRGALADLSTYPDQLDLSPLDDSVLASSRLDGKLYGVPTGTTSPGLVYNTQILGDAGLTLPDTDTWTWQQFHDFNVAITEATGRQTYGTGYYIPWPPTISQWAGQHGQSLYTEDGALGMSAQTLAEYFEMTVALRDAGGYAPAGSLDDQGTTVEDSALGKGFVASQTIPANVFADYNSALDGKLTLVRLPGEVPTPGYQVTPTLLWSQASASPHPEEAAALIDHLTNDPASFEVRSAGLGLPVNPQVATEVAATLPPDGQTFADFLIGLQDEDLPPYYLEPAGAGEIANNLVSIATEVEFGRMTPQQAGEKFVTDAQASLDRAAS